MNIFHEIYGTYFRIVKHLLKRRRMTESELNSVIIDEGYRDSCLFLQPRLIPNADGSDWGLFRKNDDGTLSANTKNDPQSPLTLLQKRWLRTKLDDPRIRLFLSDDEYSGLTEELKDTAPLYTSEMLYFYDQFSDGDPFEDRKYKMHFREILTALREREILDVSYRSGKGNGKRLRVVPFYIEYSEKNDKIRVYCIFPFSEQKENFIILNIGRILSLKRTGNFFSGDIDSEACFRQTRCEEPVTVRINPERNAHERFMMEFAPYEKRTELDTETGVMTVQLWYDSLDETEILIRLLGFGPVLEIVSPPDFRKQAVERIKRQCEIMKSE